MLKQVGKRGRRKGEMREEEQKNISERAKKERGVRDNREAAIRLGLAKEDQFIPKSCSAKSGRESGRKVVLEISNLKGVADA